MVRHYRQWHEDLPVSGGLQLQEQARRYDYRGYERRPHARVQAESQTHAGRSWYKSRRNIIMPPLPKDMKGQRIGIVEVLRYVGERQWLVRCDCGKELLRSGYVLRRAIQEHALTSCGCQLSLVATRRNSKHGFTETKTWKAWRSMRDRCLNPKNPRWAAYGGRGITLCERWKEFVNFLADMGTAPHGLTLDRINNNGN